jgi:hypothetical protein
VRPTRRGLLLVGLVLLAALLRAALMGPYYGWEESDYGNLAMVRGVLESGFVHYDMSHLPLYYGVSAAVMAVTGDAVLAAVGVAFVCGLLTVALSVVLADRIGGQTLAWVVGLIAVLQPELALYSASSLREPLYAALVLSCLLALTRERLAWASLFAGLAFLTRMDAVLVLGPVLAVHALGRPKRALRLLKALLPLFLLVAGWSLYCWQMFETWQFWGHATAVNLETGGQDKTLLSGLGVVLGLLGQTLSAHVGWALVLGFPLGLLLVPWRSHSAQRSVALAALLLLGFWLGIGMSAQHAPTHNLYWKWLYGVLPPFILISVMGLASLAPRLSRIGGKPVLVVALCLALGQGTWAMLGEMRRQVQLSQALYKPQLELARWLESNTPPQGHLLVDNIPGVWLDRRAHERELTSWFDVPVAPGNRGEMANWLRSERVSYVLWFQEDWTQAPRVAPYLASPVVHDLGIVRLVPLQQESGYGWIFYRVDPIAKALEGSQ